MTRDEVLELIVHLVKIEPEIIAALEAAQEHLGCPPGDCTHGARDLVRDVLAKMRS